MSKGHKCNKCGSYKAVINAPFPYDKKNAKPQNVCSMCRWKYLMKGGSKGE